MKNYEMKISIPIPEFLWFKKQYYNIYDLSYKIYWSAFWCRYFDHRWKEWKFGEMSPHWRKCKRCGKRELDHTDWGLNPEWHTTTYGTPEWNNI